MKISYDKKFKFLDIWFNTKVDSLATKETKRITYFKDIETKKKLTRLLIYLGK